MATRTYQIRFTLQDGRTVLWHKGGAPHLLPEELVDTWMEHFKPDVFEVTAEGMLMGVGRSPMPTFKIVKVEKILSD